MLLGSAFVLVLAAGLIALYLMGARDHRSAMAARAHLLDDAAEALLNPSLSLQEDGFPALTGRLSDRRLVTVELIPDTLVVRRLPQLWLVVTVKERFDRPRPSVGALARSTGAEWYSRVHDFPHRFNLPGNPGLELLARGESGLGGSALHRAGVALQAAFAADPALKELAATPRGVRLVRQVSEGDRGAHLLLRQSRFSLTSIAAGRLKAAIDTIDTFRAALDATADPPARLSA